MIARHELTNTLVTRHKVHASCKDSQSEVSVFRALLSLQVRGITRACDFVKRHKSRGLRGMHGSTMMNVGRGWHYSSYGKLHQARMFQLCPSKYRRLPKAARSVSCSVDFPVHRHFVPALRRLIVSCWVLI